ncbi:hypothetical protein PVA38_11000 [Streptococcus pneumoniae D39]|nr:hypothetical protein PVA38_11000 [Streptococcus pneumoniae D39]
MCIRDSSKCFAWGNTIIEKNRTICCCLWFNRYHRQQQMVRSVSYTHLTLPTKLEV